jgi:hypothetical protein
VHRQGQVFDTGRKLHGEHPLGNEIGGPCRQYMQAQQPVASGIADDLDQARRGVQAVGSAAGRERKRADPRSKGMLGTGIPPCPLYFQQQAHWLLQQFLLIRNESS